jgi:hypothetical protein
MAVILIHVLVPAILTCNALVDVVLLVMGVREEKRNRSNPVQKTLIGFLFLLNLAASKYATDCHKSNCDHIDAQQYRYKDISKYFPAYAE